MQGYDFLGGKKLANGSTDGSGLMEFCTGAMLYNDPANKTVNTLKQIYTEMSGLFPDRVFHMGGDEPYCVDKCTLESVQRMEGELARHVVASGKTPMGWEEILFRTEGAQATPNKSAIVAAWAKSSAAQIVKAGYHAVEANAAHFYLTSRIHGHNVPTSEAVFWTNISIGVPNGHANPLMLGGSMSFWTDEFSSCHQGEARGAFLFPRTQDANFWHASTGMLWPRGYMGAGSFWHYFPLNMTSGRSNTSTTFQMHLYHLNSRFRRERNVSNCHCDVETCPAQGCTFGSGCEYGHYSAKSDDLPAGLYRSRKKSTMGRAMEHARVHGDSEEVTFARVMKVSTVPAGLPGPHDRSSCPDAVSGLAINIMDFNARPKFLPCFARTRFVYSKLEI